MTKALDGTFVRDVLETLSWSARASRLVRVV
jgi:hypothetical protein